MKTWAVISVLLAIATSIWTWMPKTAARAQTDHTERRLLTQTGEPVTYTPPKRETLLVLEGTARVEIAGGPTLELAPGVIASIPAGSETMWHITPPFKEFWVIA